MRKVHCVLLFLLALVITGTSCMGGNSSDNPISPETTLTDIQAAGDGLSNRYLWSYSLITIDPESLQYEIQPVRNVSGHWNILQWLEQSPCGNCLKVKSITPTSSNSLLVNIEITHPFSDPAFTGFDVRGIMMSLGNRNFPDSSLLACDSVLGNAELLNADGHTTLYNINTFGSGPGGLQGYINGKLAKLPWPTSTLNGFKRHATDIPNNYRNAFLAGTSSAVVYEIYKPSGIFSLGYAVDASWAPATTKPVTNPMTDFPSKANSPEPWKIVADQNPVGVGLTSSGGQTVIVIDVYDYQGKATHYLPSVECPELFNGKKYSSYKSTGEGYSRFEVTISNDKFAPNGFYLALITVKDTENESSPAWLNLTGYRLIRLPVGSKIPGNIQVFTASDADPTLAERKVELKWETVSDATWYDIERYDYDWGTGAWFWKPVKSSAHPATSWIDGNPRYSGPSNPLRYRIKARNDAGVSPEWKEDTGYPSPRGIRMALWCAADDGSGSNAVTNWDRATFDFNTTNEFWNRYGLNFVLDNPSGFLWVPNPSYKNLTGNEPNDMHAAYGQANNPQSINVYYVNASEGSTSRAYTMSLCPGLYHKTQNIYIIMSKDSSGPGSTLIHITLAHECGHAVARLFDSYLLDKNGDLKMNDGSTCANTNNWCPEDPLFCDVNAAYQQEPNSFNKNPWNLMWYSVQGKHQYNYNLHETQYLFFHDWIQSAKGNYPFPQ